MLGNSRSQSTEMAIHQEVTIHSDSENCLHVHSDVESRLHVHSDVESRLHVHSDVESRLHAHSVFSSSSSNDISPTSTFHCCSAASPSEFPHHHLHPHPPHHQQQQQHHYHTHHASHVLPYKKLLYCDSVYRRGSLDAEYSVIHGKESVEAFNRRTGKRLGYPDSDGSGDGCCSSYFSLQGTADMASTSRTDTRSRQQRSSLDFNSLKERLEMLTGNHETPEVGTRIKRKRRKSLRSSSSVSLENQRSYQIPSLSELDEVTRRENEMVCPASSPAAECPQGGGGTPSQMVRSSTAQELSCPNSSIPGNQTGVDPNQGNNACSPLDRYGSLKDVVAERLQYDAGLQRLVLR